MAPQTCKYCGNEPAAFLVTEINTGDTAHIGLLCLPPFAEAAWEDAGLPKLSFDVEVPDGDQADELPAGDDEPAGDSDSKSETPPAEEDTTHDDEGTGDQGVEADAPAAAGQ